jgi:hypothetical protein
MMRAELEHLSNRIAWIDTDNLYQAINDIRQILEELLPMIDKALPKDVSEDV